MSDQYAPRPEHKFSFGLWTVSNRGRDPFGDAVRPPLSPVDAVGDARRSRRLGRQPPRQRSRAHRRHPRRARPHRQRLQAACEQHHLVVPMATVNLFFDPVFRDGAFTANDARVRAYAVQKTMRAMDLGAELGAKTFVLWGGREGTETDACRRPDEAVKRLREAINYLVRVLARPEVRLPVRARGQAQRAARRHLHGDDGRTSGSSRRWAPRARRREPGSRARDDGRPELPARRRAGAGGRQAVPHRPERPGAGPLRPGFPLRRRRTSRARSSSSSSSRTSATTARGTSTRTRTARRTTTASRTSRAAACGPT